MTFQFRKRVKIAPGISLNFGKKGVSISAGVRGARVTVGRGRTTTSVGIPGTGIYDRTTHGHRASDEVAPNASAGIARPLIICILFVIGFGTIGMVISLL